MRNSIAYVCICLIFFLQSCSPYTINEKSNYYVYDSRKSITELFDKNFSKTFVLFYSTVSCHDCLVNTGKLFNDSLFISNDIDFICLCKYQNSNAGIIVSKNMIFTNVPKIKKICFAIPGEKYFDIDIENIASPSLLIFDNKKNTVLKYYKYLDMFTTSGKVKPQVFSELVNFIKKT